MNHKHTDDINDILPNTKATVSTEEFSSLLRFRFWKPFYYKIDNYDFPSDIN